MIPILNALNVNIAVFGNHDFGELHKRLFYCLFSFRSTLKGSHNSARSLLNPSFLC